MIHVPADAPQHMHALAHANRLRIERAALREWVREPADSVVSRHRLADILDTDGPVNPCVAKMSLDAFLRFGWKMQPNRIVGVCTIADCTPHRTLGALTGRQRRLIANGLKMPKVALDEARRLHEWQQQHGDRRGIAA